MNANYIPSLAQMISTLIAAFFVRVILAIVNLWLGFDMAEYIAKIIWDQPSSAGLEAIRFAISILVAIGIIYWIRRYISGRALVGTAILLLIISGISFVSFTAGQDRPSVYTITKLVNPVIDVRVAPGQLVLEVNSGQLFEFRDRFRLDSMCRAIPDVALDFDIDPEKQGSALRTLSIPMEMDVSFKPGLPVWNGFCKGGMKKVECAIKAVTDIDPIPGDSEREMRHGRFFARRVLAEQFTEEEREMLCGG